MTAVHLVNDPRQAAMLAAPLRQQILEALAEPGSASTMARTLGLRPPEGGLPRAPARGARLRRAGARGAAPRLQGAHRAPDGPVPGRLAFRAGAGDGPAEAQGQVLQQLPDRPRLAHGAGGRRGAGHRREGGQAPAHPFHRRRDPLAFAARARGIRPKSCSRRSRDSRRSTTTRSTPTAARTAWSSPPIPSVAPGGSHDPRRSRSARSRLHVDIDAPIEAAWKAITEGPGIANWFAPVAEVSAPGDGATVKAGWSEEMMMTSTVDAWEPLRARALAGRERLDGPGHVHGRRLLPLHGERQDARAPGAVRVRRERGMGRPLRRHEDGLDLLPPEPAHLPREAPGPHCAG